MEDQQANDSPKNENRTSLWKRFIEWRRRWVRPIWCVKAAARSVASVVDFQDVLYVAGTLMLAFGAERAFGNGFGLLFAGVTVLLPTVGSFVVANKGPQR